MCCVGESLVRLWLFSSIWLLCLGRNLLIVFMKVDLFVLFGLMSFMIDVVGIVNDMLFSVLRVLNCIVSFLMVSMGVLLRVVLFIVVVVVVVIVVVFVLVLGGRVESLVFVVCWLVCW